MQKQEVRAQSKSGFTKPLFQVLNRHTAKRINCFLRIPAIPKHKGKEQKIDLCF